MLLSKMPLRNMRGQRIHINDVALRDGLQIEPVFVPTEEKVRLVNALSRTGLSKIEVTSFTSPKAIPALRDAEAVMKEIDRVPGVRYVALVPNLRGAERALECEVDEINLVMSASDTHGLANLRILKEEKIFEKVREETAPYLQKRLRELADHPLVGEVRGVGMLGAIELAKNKQTRERFPSEMGVGMICRGHCFRNGLIMRAVGDRMIIAPPLVMTRAQIDEMMGLIRLCLDATLDDLRSQGLLG